MSNDLPSWLRELEDSARAQPEPADVVVPEPAPAPVKPAPPDRAPPAPAPSGTPSGTSLVVPTAPDVVEAPAETYEDLTHEDMGTLESDPATFVPPSEPEPEPEPVLAAAPPTDEEWEKIHSRRNQRALTRQGFSSEKWYNILAKATSAKDLNGDPAPRALHPTEQVFYLLDRAKAAGREMPPMVASGGSGEPKKLNPMEAKLALTQAIKSFGDLNSAISQGGGNLLFGKDWVDWYVAELAAPGIEGWLTPEQERGVGFLPSTIPEVPSELSPGHRTNPQLLESGHVRDYSMLGQRGSVDLDASRTGNSTMKVLRAAKLLEKKGTAPEEIEAFKRENGVSALEERYFKELVKAEVTRMQTEAGDILPLGARGRVAELSEDLASAERALSLAKSKPDTTTNREAVAAAQAKVDSAREDYDRKVQIFQEDAGKTTSGEDIYEEYRREMPSGTRIPIPQISVIPGAVAGAVVRQGEGRAPVQGAAGGTGVEAVEEAIELAEYVVHQKTRVAEALYRRGALEREATAARRAYSDQDLQRAIASADANFPEVGEEWAMVGPKVIYDATWNVSDPDGHKRERAKEDWHKEKGYTWSKAHNRYLPSADAALADKRAAALQIIEQKRTVATEDIGRYKDGLRAMGVDDSMFKGVK